MAIKFSERLFLLILGIFIGSVIAVLSQEVQDFTTYTEVDPNSRISVSSGSVTATGLTNNEDAYTYFNYGWQAFNGFRFRFSTSSDNASGVIQSVDLEAGESDRLSITDASQTGLDLNSDFTFEAWINLESLPSTTGSMAIFSKDRTTAPADRSYLFYISSANNQLHCRFRDSSGNKTTFRMDGAFTSGDLGKWVHVSVAVDISVPSMTFYRGDPQSVPTTPGTTSLETAATSIKNSAVDFGIGGRMNPTPDVLFDGKIRDARVWSDIRTLTEIQNNYDQDLVGNEANLVANWQLKSDALDLTSNNNDLTNTGGTFVSEGPRVGVVCVSDDIDDVSGFSSGICSKWSYDGTNLKFRISDEKDGNFSESTTNFVQGTTYYIEGRRYSQNVRFLIYSDSDYSTLVETLTLTDEVAHADTFKYLYGLVSDNSGLTYSMDVTVSNLEWFRLSLQKFTPIVPYINANREAQHDGVGSVGDESGSFPGTGWTEDETGSGTIESSTDWAYKGSSSVKCTTTTDGEDARLSHSYTNTTSNSAVAMGVVRISSITNNHAAYLFGYGDRDNVRYIQALAVNDNGTRRWGILYYDGTWQEELGPSDKTWEYDTDYHVQLILAKMQDTGSNIGIGLLVDGQVVVTMTGSHMFNNYSDLVRVCALTNNTSVRGHISLRYVDEFYFMKQKTPQVTSMDFKPNGDLIAVSGFQDNHGFDPDAYVEIFGSADGGDTFDYEATIDRSNPETDKIVGKNVIGIGSDCWIFNVVRNDNNTIIWDTHVYKSTGCGTTWSDQSTPLNDWNFRVGIVEGNEVLGGSYEVDDDQSDNIARFEKYNHSTGSWSSGATLATAGDMSFCSTCWPNEVMLFRNPNDTDQLIAIIRWDDYADANNKFQSYLISTDDGATWGSENDGNGESYLKDEWGKLVGSLSVNIIGGEVWIVSKWQNAGSMSSVIFQINPDDMTIINYFVISYGSNWMEGGNGASVIAETSEEGQYSIQMFVESGISSYYRVLTPNILPPVIYIPERGINPDINDGINPGFSKERDEEVAVPVSF